MRQPLYTVCGSVQEFVVFEFPLVKKIYIIHEETGNQANENLSSYVKTVTINIHTCIMDFAWLRFSYILQTNIVVYA
jgi:hypothetical protein